MLGSPSSFASLPESCKAPTVRRSQPAAQDPEMTRLHQALTTACACAALTWACASPATPASNTADGAGSPDTSATGDSPSADSPGAVDAAQSASPTEYVATLADFDCIKNGTKVGHFYVANRLGKQDQAVAVAKANAKGETYPLGTVIRLFPLEAMVKRGKGFEATGGWEMFKLTTKDGQLSIAQRGGAEVTNGSGPCVGCHNPAKDYDFVCGTDHGCAPIPVTDDLVTLLQDSDTLCGP